LISSQPVRGGIISYGQYLIKSIDQGWIEVGGGQGLNNLRKRLAQLISSNQIKVFNFFIFLVIFFMLTLFLFFL
jgi:hypothetical protein